MIHINLFIKLTKDKLLVTSSHQHIFIRVKQKQLRDQMKMKSIKTHKKHQTFVNLIPLCAMLETSVIYFFLNDKNNVQT